jgi:hypothetical protein
MIALAEVKDRRRRSEESRARALRLLRSTAPRTPRVSFPVSLRCSPIAARGLALNPKGLPGTLRFDTPLDGGASPS